MDQSLSATVMHRPPVQVLQQHSDKGVNQTPAVVALHLKTGELPNLFVEVETSNASLQLLVNTTRSK